MVKVMNGKKSQHGGSERVWLVSLPGRGDAFVARAHNAAQAGAMALVAAREFLSEDELSEAMQGGWPQGADVREVAEGLGVTILERALS